MNLSQTIQSSTAYSSKSVEPSSTRTVGKKLQFCTRVRCTGTFRVLLM